MANNDIKEKVRQAIDLLDTQLAELEKIVQETSLRDTKIGFDRVKRWKSHTVKLISERINPLEGKKLEEEQPGGLQFAGRESPQNLWELRYAYEAFLTALKTKLQQDPEDVLSTSLEKSEPVKTEVETRRKVFIVHGHDEATKESVAQFLKKLDLEAIILHEQANRGKTIIEKLESSSSELDIDYAIIILTPDDVGAGASKKHKLQPRARQNVVFELGYSIAKLGRQRVRALYTEGVELPSDYQGVLYTLLDKSGAWKLELAREIKAAGIDIDLNKLQQQHIAYSPIEEETPPRKIGKKRLFPKEDLVKWLKEH